MTRKSEPQAEQHWVKAYDSVIRAGWLTPNEIAVYLNLLSHQGINATAWPSHETIAGEVGIHSRTVARTIKKLQAKALVQVIPRFEGNGRQTSNAYQVTRVPLPPASCLAPRDRESYKEDSSQEDSLKTSTKVEGKKDWRYLSPTKPPTSAQLDYICDLIMDIGGCGLNEARAVLDELIVPSQKAADEIIRDLYVEGRKIREFGHFGDLDLLLGIGEEPLPLAPLETGAVSTHTDALKSESTPVGQFEEVR